MEDGIAVATDSHKTLIKASNLRKEYHPTVAVRELDIEILSGEVLALIGANGAGKSTLVKILSGVVAADKGAINVSGEDVDITRYSPLDARSKGIRVVHQELSLCKNLMVYENFYIELSQHFITKPGWRGQARKMAREALDRVFPGHNIDVRAGLSTLSIAQQQMVEIARATCDPDVKLLILDEPSSSLPTEQTEQLQQYIKKSAAEGIAYIYISHRLNEVIYLADSIFLMQNGVAKWHGRIAETSEEDLIRKMGEGIPVENTDHPDATSKDFQINQAVCVELTGYKSGKLRDISLKASGGEIVGLAGLEGNGQLDILQDIFRYARRRHQGIRVEGRVAYVAGDRKKEGIFPLGSILENMSISKISEGGLFRVLSGKRLDEMTGQWHDKLRIKSTGLDAPIVSLSGGNQQKVLIARALASDADIILLDDPTRGVDIATKSLLYQVFRELAAKGKLVIWRSSDDTELQICTRLIVINNYTIAAEFESSQLDYEEVMKAAFSSYGSMQSEEQNLRKSGARRQPMFLFALIAMIILYSTCGYLSSAIFSKFGIGLLALGFTPLVFVALSQTFVIGLGHIDLSVGAFMGLCNVFCSTILQENLFFGIVCLIVILFLYASMGLLIYGRKLPAIIVTLGMSFVWFGIALSIQEMPGGQTPQWLISLLNFKNPVTHGIIFVLILFIAIAVVFYRSRYGTVLRGFGNNETAMRNSGWSPARAYFFTYLAAGFYAMLGGMSFGVITGASDINASTTFTMLTVASVIIGGGYFSGGVVTHLGTVFGAVSLTMASVLLGLFRVSTDYTATIQGLILIVILSLRLLRKGGFAYD